MEGKGYMILQCYPNITSSMFQCICQWGFSGFHDLTRCEVDGITDTFIVITLTFCQHQKLTRDRVRDYTHLSPHLNPLMEKWSFRSVYFTAYIVLPPASQENKIAQLLSRFRSGREMEGAVSLGMGSGTRHVGPLSP